MHDSECKKIRFPYLLKLFLLKKNKKKNKKSKTEFQKRNEGKFVIKLKAFILLEAFEQLISRMDLDSVQHFVEKLNVFQIRALTGFFIQRKIPSKNIVYQTNQY